MWAYLEHLSSNRRIKYPFSESANLPKELLLEYLVDMLIVTRTDTVYYISRIDRTDEDIILYFNNLFQISIPHGTKDSIIKFSDTNHMVKILVGDGETNYLSGSYQYTLDQTKTEPSCVLKQSSLVDTVSSKDIALEGDIKLASGFNTELIQNDPGNEIVIDILPGAGLGHAPCSHSEYENENRKPVCSINGTEVDRNILVYGDACTEIINYPDLHMIAIRNICAPCCEDCDEKLNEIEESDTTMQGDINNLDSRIDTLEGP
jgi:hypothetical protein